MEANAQGDGELAATRDAAELEQLEQHEQQQQQHTAEHGARHTVSARAMPAPRAAKHTRATAPSPPRFLPGVFLVQKCMQKLSPTGVTAVFVLVVASRKKKEDFPSHNPEDTLTT